MKTVKGDLIKLALDKRFDVIIHGCNCMCEMGAGIAKVIRSRFPEAYEADLKTEKGSRDKLGTISYAAELSHDALGIRINHAASDLTSRVRCSLARRANSRHRPVNQRRIPDQPKHIYLKP